MAWVKLDDNFPDHPKVVLVGPLAGWLHVCGLAYCNRFLTDGFVPASQVPKLADFSGIAEQAGSIGDLAELWDNVEIFDLAQRLVKFGLWADVAGGYLIHNYLDYQPSKAEVEARRKQRASAGRKGGQAKAKRTASGSASEAEAKGEAESCPVPDPVPVPSSSSPSDSTALSDEEEEEVSQEVERRLRQRRGEPLADVDAWKRKVARQVRAEVVETRDQRAEHAGMSWHEGTGWVSDLRAQA